MELRKRWASGQADVALSSACRRPRRKSPPGLKGVEVWQSHFKALRTTFAARSGGAINVPDFSAAGHGPFGDPFGDPFATVRRSRLAGGMGPEWTDRADVHHQSGGRGRMTGRIADRIVACRSDRIGPGPCSFPVPNSYRRGSYTTPSCDSLRSDPHFRERLGRAICGSNRKDSIDSTVTSLAGS